MLIGISGKIGSGKDTIGKIIQYLVRQNTIDDSGSFIELLKTWEKDEKVTPNCGTNWEIKKFAAKLKEVCSLLTGIPVEDFEKQEVKDRLLGVDWDKFNYIEPNRNETIDEFDLAEKYGYNFDNLIKNKVSLMERSKIKEECLEKAKKDGYQKLGFSHFYYIPKVERIQHTIRWLLQTVGTEAMRNNIHENVWVNALFSDYKPKYKDRGIGSIHDSHLGPINEGYPNWIITDLRFSNELEAVKKRKGICIRVSRTEFHTEESFKNSQHPSETSLDHITDWDYIIDNSGNIEELVEKVKDILIKEKII